MTNVPSDLTAATRAAASTGMEIAAVARLDPQRLAIRSPQGDCSFHELNRRANQVARLVRRLGVKAGDAVALLCGNCTEFAEVRFAAHRLGVRLTTVNWHLAPEEAAYIVEDCEAVALFADIRAEAAAVCALSAASLRGAYAIGGDMPGFQSYRQAVDAESGDDIEQAVLGSMMLYTSGTTGRPKGVARRSPDPEQAANMQALLTAVFQFDPDSGHDRALVTGPLYHSGPFNLCLTTPLTAGIGVVMMDKWDAEETLRLIDRERITHSFFVPTMFVRMLALPEQVRERYDLSSLRFVIHGAAPCPVAVKQRMLDWFGPVIWEMFAGTEGAGTIVSPQEWLERPGTVGRSGPDQIRILDEAGRQLPAGSEGQVWIVNPPQSRFEYHNAPEKTRAVQRDGYFTAGDIGYLDEAGYLFLTGRSAEVIISGGVNIYPQEIDDVLLGHPAVADVACVGVPDAEWGEAVRALVQLAPGRNAGPDLESELFDLCAAHLARQKWPRSIEYIDQIPRSPAGKVLRRQLRDRYWPERTAQA